VDVEALRHEQQDRYQKVNKESYFFFIFLDHLYIFLRKKQKLN